MNHYVYEITNKINGKKYIGKRSCKCEITDDKYMGSGYALKNATNKYGLENFEKKIICVCNTEEEAYCNERDLIRETNANISREYYNISEGGNGFTSDDARRFYEENKDNRLEIIRELQNKRIVLLNNSMVFDSIVEASNFIGLKSRGGITMCCKGERNYAGNINGEKLAWMYYDEYLEKIK